WLAGEDIEAARAGLTDLKDWAPGDAESLIAVSELAAALGDRRLELEFIRALVGKAVPERAVLERQAQLELDVGNAGAGLAILEQLQLQHPEEPGIGASLERARFDWRLTMLPDSAQGLAASPELDRGQLAALLYWVFPRVRHSRPAKAIIASDVLDHPYRTEIVRVVNLGIMAIDPNLHAFRPHDAAQRADALLGLLRVLERSRGALDCFGGSAVDADLSLESTCELAARCQLLDEPADCLPRATLPGSTAMNMARNATRQLEQE
ncbi:MAG: hypothetical protein O7A98_03675, partial [Acidobacteria bacterium]|nr:hypothetical protein [Acidobacteriota bacterium]